MRQKFTKKALAKKLGLSRSSLYYRSKKTEADWQVKILIEKAMSDRPGYGYRRIARQLKINKKKAQRVMQLFGIRAYRRRGRKYKRNRAKNDVIYPNLLLTEIPRSPNQIWASDFTEIHWRQTKLFLATVIDLFSREIVGFALMTNHSAALVLQSLFVALHGHRRPLIFHSDNGREYISKIFVEALKRLGILISRSHPGRPWENGYQEGFYSQFKNDLGDPNRFGSLGELVYEINRLIYDYNHGRIHSAIKMPPRLFAERHQKVLEKVS